MSAAKAIARSTAVAAAVNLVSESAGRRQRFTAEPAVLPVLGM